MSFRSKAITATVVISLAVGAGVGFRYYQAPTTQPNAGQSPSESISAVNSPTASASSSVSIQAYQPGWRTVNVKAAMDGSPHTGVDDKTQTTIEHCGKEPLANTVENRAKGVVWLTFDDYGSTQQVESILNTLKAKNVRGRFFFKKDWANKNITLMQQISAEGHFVGNHTKSHQALYDVKAEHSGNNWQVRDKQESAIRSEISGGVESTSLRPPFGAYDLRVMQIVSSMQTSYSEQISICTWTNDSEDWNIETTPTANAELERVKKGTTPNGVVLFHAHGRFTGQILPSYIDWLVDNGYQVEKLKR